MKNSKTATKNVKQKQTLILGLIGVLFLLIVSYQLFWDSASPVPGDVSADQRPGRISVSDLNKQAEQQDQVTSRPAGATAASPSTDVQSYLVKVDEKMPWEEGKDGVSIARNPFVYPPPPPPKPLPPPKPATLPISYVSPTSVYAQTKAFELVVRGQQANFTPETKIYLNGNPVVAPTTFVSPGELKTTVPQQLFATPTAIRVEVRVPGKDSELFSNSIDINVMPPPPPRFEMLGRISDGTKNARAILLDGEQRVVAPVGSNVGSNWKVVSVGPNFIEVEDISTAIGVRHRVKMKEDNGGGNNPYASYAQTYTPPTYEPPSQDAVHQSDAVAAGVVNNTPAGQTIDQNQQNQQNQQNFVSTGNPTMDEIIRRRREEIQKEREAVRQRIDQFNNRIKDNNFQQSPSPADPNQPNPPNPPNQ